MIRENLIFSSKIKKSKRNSLVLMNTKGMSPTVSVQSVRRRRIGSLFLCHNLLRFSVARPINKQTKKKNC